MYIFWTSYVRSIYVLSPGGIFHKMDPFPSFIKHLCEHISWTLKFPSK